MLVRGVRIAFIQLIFNQCKSEFHRIGRQDPNVQRSGVMFLSAHHGVFWTLRQPKYFINKSQKRSACGGDVYSHHMLIFDEQFLVNFVVPQTPWILLYDAKASTKA